MDTPNDIDIEEAKASLIARADELSRRVRDAKQKFDIKTKIVENPQLAVGAALAAGAVLAFLVGGPRARPRVIVKQSAAPSEPVKSGLMSAAGAMIGTLVMRFARDYAMSHLVERARHWIDEAQLQQAGASPREAGASQVTETESFLRH